MALPSSMTIIHQPSPTTFSLTLTTHPLPKPSSGTYLIHTKAASPCRDELTWESAHPAIFPHGRQLPRVPCFDGAGVIVQLPPDQDPQTSEFKVGDGVFYQSHRFRPGSLAEYTLTLAEEMVRIPEGVTFEEASATPISAATAWQGLFRYGELSWDDKTLNQGKKVLVTGATGGVGSWVVQLAALAGVTVIATSSPSNIQLAKDLGADHIIDYTKPSQYGPWTDTIDLIIDTVGGETLSAVWRTIKPDSGIILSVSNDAPDGVKPKDLEKKVKKSEWFLVDNSKEDMSSIAELMAQGKCKPLIDSVYELKDYEEAFAKVEKGHCKGKVVIRTQV